MGLARAMVSVMMVAVGLVKLMGRSLVGGSEHTGYGRR